MQKAKPAVKRASINVDRCVMNDDTYTVVDMHKQPENVGSSSVTTTQCGDMMGSPLFITQAFTTK